MLASIQKLLAVTGTPIAAIVAIGVLAEVMNLWRVEKSYKFSYVEGWHAVGLVDRWIIIGLGVKYLFFTLLILLPLLVLYFIARRLVRKWRSSTPSATEAQGTWTAWWIQTSASPGSESRSDVTAWWTQASTGSGDDTPKSVVEWWIWLVVVSTGAMFLWLPFHAWVSPNDEKVLDHLPHVALTVTEDSSSSSVSTEGNSQTFTGVAKPAEQEDENTYAVTGSIESADSESQDEQQDEPATITGILLSHDANYWYVLSQEGLHSGNIVAVALDEAGDIRVTSPQTPEEESSAD